MDHHIPDKANRVLNVILLGFLLILIRVWYLCIVQHEEHLEKARRPKRRVVIEKPERATICDRFNIPLALNKIQYNATLCYADIRQIPKGGWEVNAEGKRVRVSVRSTYIKKLSQIVAKELQLDPQSVEDTIHGKASLFPHTPFVLKEDLTEEEYYHLKAMEKDWIGIRAERGSRRCYPLGKVGSDIVGYIGAINSREYHAIANELNTLQTYLNQREIGEIAILPKGFQNPLEVRERLQALQEKAYRINDLVGKAGIEGAFDADLRGYAGKKICEVNTQGNVLRELPGGRKEIFGQRLFLSLSSELQEFAERLLIDNEKVREARLQNAEVDLSTPWIKGGAIVAFDPNTGEVLALASYPRFDPNDFIASRTSSIRASKQSAVFKWLENEAYIAEIWEGRRPLERERLEEKSSCIYTESIDLTLSRYLETILAASSGVSAAMRTISTLSTAIFLQRAMDKLLDLSHQAKMSALIEALYPHTPHRSLRAGLEVQVKQDIQRQLALSSVEVSSLRLAIDPILRSIPYNDDKLLVIDLCRLIADGKRFSNEILNDLDALSLSDYHQLNQSTSVIKSALCAQAKEWFHQKDFQTWRETSFKDHLQQKRREEKAKKRYSKPYTDYLEQMEKQLFKAFWEENRHTLLHACVLGAQVNSPLAFYLDKIVKLRENDSTLQFHAERVKQVICSLELKRQAEFLRTFRSFEELDQPLYGRYRPLRNSQGVQCEKHLAAAFYPISGYGYGRSQAFRQSTPQGSVFKVVVAYQALLERYQKLKALQQSISSINPLTIIDSLQWSPKANSVEQVVGYTLDGQPIKRLYKGGMLLRSHPNIGKITIEGAIEQSSNLYFSLLAVDHIADPSHLIQVSQLFGFGEKTGIELPAEITGALPDDLAHNRTGLYAFAIGQHSLVVTPLQTAIMLGAIANKGHVLKPKVIQMIAGQEPLRDCRDPFAQTLYTEEDSKMGRCQGDALNLSQAGLKCSGYSTSAEPIFESRAVYPFKDSLASIGIHFPLFTSTQSEAERPYVWYNAPEIRRTLFMPDSIRAPLIQGMHQVITSPKGSARPSVIQALAKNREWMHTFQELKSQLIGKTGTAEILYKQTIDAESEATIKNHIWFGGIAFPPETPQSWDRPELVVVVYLRFSKAGGKEAAPLATEIVKKWREIRKHHGMP
jgi:cell division protein FtsI/penicillin-binding protein 2